MISALDDTLATSRDSFAFVIISGAVGLRPESAMLDSCGIYYNGRLALNSFFKIDGEFHNSNPFPIAPEDKMFFFSVYGLKAPSAPTDTAIYDIELKDEKGLVSRSRIVVNAL